MFCSDTSDVRLVVDGVQVPAHIAVLSTQSPVFAAMFHADMLERNFQVVNIHNVPLNAVQVLRFLYNTGRVHDLDGTLYKLLIFADMFLSERYNSKELKRQALNFISENMHEVFETPQWLIKSHPYKVYRLIQTRTDRVI